MRFRAGILCHLRALTYRILRHKHWASRNRTTTLAHHYIAAFAEEKRRQARRGGPVSVPPVGAFATSENQSDADHASAWQARVGDGAGPGRGGDLSSACSHVLQARHPVFFGHFCKLHASLVAWVCQHQSLAGECACLVCCSAWLLCLQVAVHGERTCKQHANAAPSLAQPCKVCWHWLLTLHS